MQKSRISKDIDNNDKDNARVGYQAAINLWTYQGGEIWARFNVMLVANSILIGVIGLDIITHSTPSIFSLILSFFGLGICFAWFLLMNRSNCYQKYYVHSAYELEEIYLSNTVNTVLKGKTFGKGEKVLRIIDGKPKPLEMNKWSYLFNWHILSSTENISYIIIFLFILIYIYIFSFFLFSSLFALILLLK